MEREDVNIAPAINKAITYPLDVPSGTWLDPHLAVLSRFEVLSVHVSKIRIPPLVSHVATDSIRCSARM